MSRNIIKLLGIHLALLTLIIISFNLAGTGDGKGQFFTFIAGALSWPVLGSLRDLFREAAAAIRAQ